MPLNEGIPLKRSGCKGGGGNREWDVAKNFASL